MVLVNYVYCLRTRGHFKNGQQQTYFCYELFYHKSALLLFWVAFDRPALKTSDFSHDDL